MNVKIEETSNCGVSESYPNYFSDFATPGCLCYDCGRGFKDANTLRMHQMRHHAFATNGKYLLMLGDDSSCKTSCYQIHFLKCIRIHPGHQGQCTASEFVEVDTDEQTDSSGRKLLKHSHNVKSKGMCFSISSKDIVGRPDNLKKKAHYKFHYDLIDSGITKLAVAHLVRVNKDYKYLCPPCIQSEFTISQ